MAPGGSDLADSADGLRLASNRLRDEVLAETPPSLLRALHERAAGVFADSSRPAHAVRQLLARRAGPGPRIGSTPSWCPGWPPSPRSIPAWSRTC